MMKRTLWALIPALIFAAFLPFGCKPVSPSTGTPNDPVPPSTGTPADGKISVQLTGANGYDDKLFMIAVFPPGDRDQLDIVGWNANYVVDGAAEDLALDSSSTENPMPEKVFTGGETYDIIALIFDEVQGGPFPAIPMRRLRESWWTGTCTLASSTPMISAHTRHSSRFTQSENEGVATADSRLRSSLMMVRSSLSHRLSGSAPGRA